jgi:PD-(D/E)XK endonuclease
VARKQSKGKSQQQFNENQNQQDQNKNSKKHSRKNPGMKIKNCKTRGEWTELVFMQRAIEHGLRFGKPWGEPKGYDFAVERGGKFVSVQVKSTMSPRPAGGYACTLKDSKGKYRGSPFEFLAAYVIATDTWFIVPGKKVRGMSNIVLYPHSQRAKYTPYQEAWHLLRADNSDPEPIEIMACVDEAHSTDAVTIDTSNEPSKNDVDERRSE